jgi:hypothetical protein
MDYKYANFGAIVSVEGKRGVITMFDESNPLNTKVIYETGGFDWFSRDELEKSLEK